MQNNNYTNREGVKVYSMQYVVDDLEFAESKKNSSEDGSVQEAPPANQPSQSAQPSQAAQPRQAAQSRQPAQQSRAAQPNQASSRQPSRQPARQAARPAPRGTRQNAPVSNKDDFMNIDAGMDDGDLPFN